MCVFMFKRGWFHIFVSSFPLVALRTEWKMSGRLERLSKIFQNLFINFLKIFHLFYCIKSRVVVNGFGFGNKNVFLCKSFHPNNKLIQIKSTFKIHKIYISHVENIYFLSKKWFFSIQNLAVFAILHDFFQRLNILFHNW